MLRFGGVVGSGAFGVKCKMVLAGVCRGRNAFFMIMNWRASVYELPLRRDLLEVAGVNVADCALGPQSADFCENVLLKVCPRCWFSSFYCFVPPLFDTQSHEWSIERGVSPAVV